MEKIKNEEKEVKIFSAYSFLSKKSKWVGLAIAAVLAKVIGAVYKIPLVNILGAEGIGLYQLIFPVYAAAIAISSGGAGVVVSRNVSACYADGSIRNKAGSALIYTVILSVITAGLLIIFADPISRIQGNGAIRTSYYIIAPSIVAVGISACIRGIFAGTGRIKYTSLSQISEQIIKLIAGLALTSVFIRKGLIWGVCGAVAGVTISETVGTVINLICYAGDKKTRAVKLYPERNSGYMKEYAPVMLNNLILPLSALIDSVTVVRLLTLYGYKGSTAAYGLMTGTVNTVINMPVVIAISLAVVAVPALSYSYAGRDAARIKAKSSCCVKTAMAVSVPCFFGIYVLAPEITNLLFPALGAEESAFAATLLRIGGVNVILASLAGIYTAVLQALNESSYCLKASAVIAAARVVTAASAAYFIGIKGVMLSWVLFYAAELAIFIRKHSYLLGADSPLVKSNCKILLSGVIMCIIILPVKILKNPLYSVIVSITAAFVTYIPLILLTDVMSEEEMKALPFGEKICAVKERIRRGRKESGTH